MLRKSIVIAAALALLVPAVQGQQNEPGFRFKSGVELINVNATVSDASGRFVAGLTQEDFAVFEDGEPVQVTHFSADRVPVSLGIALDTSGSMTGQKIRSAEDALNRFVYDLLDAQDEMFLYRFSNVPMLLQDWTSDRQLIARALYRVSAGGGTAMYDAVSDAIPLTKRGKNPKKALLVISDGNDTTSRTDIAELKQQIRASEALVYAIGIDGDDEPMYRPPRQPPMPIPLPFPGRGRGGYPFPGGGGGGQGWPRSSRSDDRVNVVALREMTDDSGGRTEVIRDARDLDPSTASIADELSKQYYLGYPSSGKKDGRWHTIRVEVRNRNYRVRARRGYTAS